jgi:hypothetical protein
VQQAPATHFVVAPEQAQVTLPQALASVVSHCEPHFGSSQHCSFTQVDPAAQANVRAPQALVSVPQYVGFGRAGSAQQVPGPPLPVVVHPKPLPHEVAEQVRAPQELLTCVLHAAPSPPHAGNVQQVPGMVLSGWLHCDPDAQPQV